VLMLDGSLKRCDEIVSGDVVHSGATIKCVIQTICVSGKQSLVRLSSSLRATPWHPVCVNNKWTFPIHLQKARVEDCTATWNFILVCFCLSFKTCFHTFSNFDRAKSMS
jgi:hypothetical protein